MEQQVFGVRLPLLMAESLNEGNFAMMRWVFAMCLMGVVLPGMARAEVDCSAVQAAFRVPVPAGVSDDPQGALGCSRVALEMFVANRIAVERAVPVSDPADLHGVWLSDLVLPQLIGVEVSGQEVLVVAPGPEPDSLKITQYWMKAVEPPANPLWSEDAEYLGLVAEVTLTKPGGDTLVFDGLANSIKFGSLQLEFGRSHDLLIKTRLNHFESRFGFRIFEDVLVLDSSMQHPITRDVQEYSQTYTRIAPGAAELALGTVAVFQFNQARYFDCLTHQISDGKGPFVDALGEDGLPGLQRHVEKRIRLSAQRKRISNEMDAAWSRGDDAAYDRLRQEMARFAEQMRAIYIDPEQRAFVERFMATAPVACPDIR